MRCYFYTPFPSSSIKSSHEKILATLLITDVETVFLFYSNVGNVIALHGCENTKYRPTPNPSVFIYLLILLKNIYNLLIVCKRVIC